MTERQIRLNEFASAISIPLHNTDGIKWPVRSGTVISEIGDIYALEYLAQLEQLAHNVNPSCWFQAFASSLSIWKVAHHLINGLKKADMEGTKIAQYIDMMIDVINVLSNGEPLLRDDHRILSESEIASLSKNYPLMTEALDCEHLINFAAILWAYSDSLFFQGREICCEYHGPYCLKDNVQIIVRDYRHLIPKELWPELVFDDTVQSVRIVTFHDSTLVITFDVYNNINILHGSYQASCRGGLLFVNDKLLSPKHICTLTDYFLEKIEQQTRYVNGMERYKLYKRYADIFWYRKKHLAKMIGQQWRPPQKVYDIINSLDIVQKAKNPHGEMTLESVAKLFDYSEYIDE